VSYALSGFLFAAEGQERLTLEVEKILLTDERAGSDFTAA
jgi:hypothetical protein